MVELVKDKNMSERKTLQALSELPVITPEGIWLKPCPFCGGKAVFIPERNSSSDKGIGYDFRIKCRDCGLLSPKIYKVELELTKGGLLNPHHDERKQAADIWNRRADPLKDSN